jgi:hypothetical protein
VRQQLLLAHHRVAIQTSPSMAASAGHTKSPTHGEPLLSNPSDRELETELILLHEATVATGVKTIRKLLKEKHPHWTISESRVRQAWNTLIDKKPAGKKTASSVTDGPSRFTPSAEELVGYLQDWLPHFAKKKNATMMFFSCPPGDIRYHTGERERMYRNLFDDMAAHNQLWMDFLSHKENHKDAEHICGILVRQ